MPLFRLPSAVVLLPDFLPTVCHVFLLSSLLSPPSRSITKDYQWRITAATTTLKMVGKSA